VDTVFFGQPCKTHRTPALLHLKTGIPIVPELTRRVGDDFSFEIVLGPMIEYTPTDDKEHDIQVICQMCTTALEKMIAEQPEQWLWPHRRWININREHRRK
jgi:KDO2-lipid IV(A) lauroyltransferase